MDTLYTLFILGIISLLVGLKATKEAFGTSPGTLVQLAANHVPTEAELRAAQGFYMPRPDPTILIVIIMMLVLLLGVVLVSK